jgi:arginase
MNWGIILHEFQTRFPNIEDICFWGRVDQKGDFAAELKRQLDEKSFGPSLVHLDLDVLDESYGKVNDYPSPGGMFETELITCMGIVPKKSNPKSLTMCSFDPNAGDGDKIGQVSIRSITRFLESLLEPAALSKT